VASTETAAGSSNGRVWLVWVTSVEHGVDHAVADDEMAAAITNDRAFKTQCGTTMLPAPMVCAPRSACRQCVSVLAAKSRARVHRATTARHCRSSSVARTLRWLVGMPRG